jgi:hypothetical protein
MILNLTQHKSSPEQISEGVVDLPPDLQGELNKLLTFEECPTHSSMKERAYYICNTIICYEVENNIKVKTVMIGGATFFMSILETILKEFNYKFLYAFSKRESIEQPQADGSIRKVSVFKHAGFVEV